MGYTPLRILSISKILFAFEEMIGEIWIVSARAEVRTRPRHVSGRQDVHIFASHVPIYSLRCNNGRISQCHFDHLVFLDTNCPFSSSRQLVEFSTSNIEYIFGIGFSATAAWTTDPFNSCSRTMHEHLRKSPASRCSCHMSNIGKCAGKWTRSWA